MKWVLIFTICQIVFVAKAQTQKQNQNKFIQLDIVRSYHGTGDMQGYGFTIDYKKLYSRKLSLSFGLGATLHDGVYPIFYNTTSGNQIDASYRYTTGGFQVSGKGGYSFIQNDDIDFGIQLGALLRYQSSSFYDELSVIFPIGTGLPIPVTAIINKTPQKTIAIGGIGQIHLNVFLNEKFFTGILASLQTDTNGDTISQFGVSFGFRLN